MGPPLDRMGRTFPKAVGLRLCGLQRSLSGLLLGMASTPSPARNETSTAAPSALPADHTAPDRWPHSGEGSPRPPPRASGRAGRTTASSAHLLVFSLPSTPPALSGGFCSGPCSQILPTGALPSLAGPFLRLTVKPFPPGSRPGSHLSSGSWEREARLCSRVCPQLALNTRQVTLTASASVSLAGGENGLACRASSLFHTQNRDQDGGGAGVLAGREPSPTQHSGPSFARAGR